MHKKFVQFFLVALLIACTACNSTAITPTQTVIPSLQATTPVSQLSTATAAPTQAPTALATTAVPTAAATNTSMAPTSGPFTITDDLGRQVTFSQAPQRIVLAGKGLIMVTDAVYAIPGAGDKVVALSPTKQGAHDFMPILDASIASKVTLSNTPTVDDIAATKPDCVISNVSNSSTLKAPLEALNIPVVFLDFETPDHYQVDLKILGQIFNNTKRTDEVAAFYTGKVKSITDKLSTLTDAQKPKTLLLYYNVSNNAISFNIAPDGWMQTIMVETAGGNPVWKGINAGSGWKTVTIEQIAAWNPDDIFIVAYFQSVDDVVKQLKADSQWQALSAVKNNKLFGFVTDVYSWDQPDARWILGLTWMAGKLHPDLFPSLDIVQEAENFYQTLYGIDTATYQKEIQPLMIGDYK